MLFPPITIKAQLCRSSDSCLDLMSGTNPVYQVVGKGKYNLSSYPLFPVQDGSALKEAANISAAEDDLLARYCWTIGFQPENYHSL